MFPRRSRAGLVPALLALAALAFPRLADAQFYAITDLGAFNGGARFFQNTLGGGGSFAFGLNNSGRVAGMSFAGDGTIHAFLWDPTSLLRDLAPPAFLASAGGVNDGDMVAGYAVTDGGAEAFLWDGAGSMLNLGTLGGAQAFARGINNNGWVVGASQISSLGGVERAFLWRSAGGMQDLGTLGGEGSEANGINAANQIVGAADTASGNRRAFIWTGAGGMRDLGTLPGGTRSAAYGINRFGQIVGNSVRTGGDWHAFVWTRAGGLHDLGALPGGDYSLAYSINSDCLIVGYSNTDSNGPFFGVERAVLWDSAGGRYDLNDLIPAGSGWELLRATAINEDGQIVGYGLRGGERRAFLLTPQ